MKGLMVLLYHVSYEGFDGRRGTKPDTNIVILLIVLTILNR